MIYIIKTNDQWTTHQHIIQMLDPSKNTPSPPSIGQCKNNWIKILSTKAKEAKIAAQKIIAKQTTTNCRKAILKYKNILDKMPKQIHQIIFKGDNT
jgi:hypothetical protein